MSPQFTVAGIQDGSFEPFQRGNDSRIQHTSLCCTCLQGSRILDIKLTSITVDGLDATGNMLNIVDSWNLDAIILGGATFAGFNVIDVENVYKISGTPVIVFSPHYPDMEATLSALRKHFTDWELRWDRYEKMGEIYSLKIRDEPIIYYERIGCDRNMAEKILCEQAIVSRTPEAVRVANLVAKGVSSFFRGPVGCVGDSLG